MAWIGAAIVLALAVNASILWSTAEYSSESYRGKSNLTAKTEPGNGLAKEYAFEWSEGVGETMTVLVPNLYGGGTGLGALDENSEIVKTLSSKGVPAEQIGQFMQQLPGIGISTYWGDKQFTEGPFYFGAIVCFLFVFGLLVIRNRIKWWLLTAIILSILLSWGRNLSFFSDFFFNYFPLYNKFRAVESIMVIAALCFPIMAYLAVSETIANPDKKYLLGKLKIALYIVGGITLLLVITPDSFFSFRTLQQQQSIDYLANAMKGDTAFATSIGQAITHDRVSLARMDAIRTLVFVTADFWFALGIYQRED